jgi:predicted ester cyclase
MKKSTQIPKLLVLALLTGTILLGISCTNKKSNSDFNIGLERKIHDEVWSKGNLTVVDEIFSKDLIRHSADVPEMKGLEDYKKYIQSCRIAFPDWTETVQEVVASGDMVATRIIITATQTGKFSNAQPTGKKLETNCAVFVRVGPEKKIIELWSYYDMTPFVKAMTPDSVTIK